MFTEAARENPNGASTENLNGGVSAGTAWPSKADPKKEEDTESEESYLKRLKEYWDRVNRGVDYPGPMPTRGAGHGYAKSGS